VGSSFLVGGGASVIRMTTLGSKQTKMRQGGLAQGAGKERRRISLRLYL